MKLELRVLIVEDSDDDTELLLRQFHQAGYSNVVWSRVDDAESMRGALRGGRWDLVVSDFSMPALDAFAAIEILHDSDLDLPFIIVSGTIGEDRAVQAMRAGAHDYILKDSLKRLVPAIERELREARSRAERRLAEAAVNRLNVDLLRFRETLDQTLDCIFIFQADNFRFTYVNRGAQVQTGYGEAELLSATVFDLYPAIGADDIRARVESVLDGPGGPLTVETLLRHKSGRRVPVEASLQCVRLPGRLPDFVAVVRDVAARKQAEATIHRLAYTDPITRLPNRNRFQELIAQCIETAAVQRRCVGLLLIDLERFKEVNDTLGHASGDELLRQVGVRIRTALFKPDLVARIGGDEFGILLPHLAEAGDVRLAVGKIQRCLHEPFVIDGVPIVVEASIGAVTMPEHGAEASTLFRRADIAMYQAKHTASGYAVYAPTEDGYSPERLALMAELRQGIDERELVLHFQPKVELCSRTLVGLEALVRWQHPRRGLLFPDQFIVMAEHTGLIGPLTHRVMEAALEFSQGLKREGMPLAVSVNLSARLLHNPALIEWVEQALQTTGAQSDQLILEITESAIMLEPRRAAEGLAALHGLGVRISIDDFGTGYTSLASIKWLPISEIKIDRSFITHMLNDTRDAVLTRAVIDLGRNLGLTVVAEGVESQAVLNALGGLGCDQAQGYYISRPLPADAFVDWLTRSPWAATREP